MSDISYCYTKNKLQMYYNELAMEWTTRIQFPVGIVFFTFVTRSGACATLYSVRKWKGQNVKPTICS